jgi:hypothetical protein
VKETPLPSGVRPRLAVLTLGRRGSCWIRSACRRSRPLPTARD